MKALRTARPSVRTAGPAALLLGAAVLLTGCGAQRPGAAAVVDGRVISVTDAQQVAEQISTVPGVQQKLTPADTLVSLILAPFVIDQAAEGRQGRLGGPGPRRGQGDQEPEPGHPRSSSRPAWPPTS